MFNFVQFLSGMKKPRHAAVRQSFPAIEVMENRVLLSASPVHHHRHNDGPNHDLHDNHVVRMTIAPAASTKVSDEKPGHDANDDKADDTAHDKAEKRHGGQDDPKGHH